VFTDYNAERLVFRIRLNQIMQKGGGGKTMVGGKKQVNPLDQSDQIYLLKQFQDQLLHNIVLRGIKGIKNVTMRKIKDNLVAIEGSYKKQDVWVLDTTGTNMLEVLALDYIDNRRVYSNDIVEVYETLGIEAARQTIYNEITDVIEFDGTYLNTHHFQILCDRMTFTSKMISIFRHGINNDNIGPIAKASFEETPEMFLKAARHGELDTMRGISANIMCGQKGRYGTSAFQVVLNVDELRKLQEAVAGYETVDARAEIDKQLGEAAAAAETDTCSMSQLTVENTASQALPKDWGMTVNRRAGGYNPGF
jgi:DNA-directed RNA polymerase II subunit RPB1